MMDQNEQYDLQFYQIVVSLHAAAMQQMGKIASPLSGKVERDLTQAQNSIDLLSMLQRKTRGNLTEEERTLLDRVLFELRMNFVDESKKEEAAPEQPSPQSESAEEKPESEPAESAPGNRAPTDEEKVAGDQSAEPKPESEASDNTTKTE
jgi:hypothetical protein